MTDPSDTSGKPIDLQNDSLGYAIKLAQVRAYELLYRMYGPETLSPARMTALSMISTEPGINQSALAQRLRITRAGVVKLVDALEALGFVSRDPIPGDRRSYALMLTRSGQKELMALSARAERFEQALAEGLSPAERRLLMELLGRVGAP